jgi:hypothetical protein
MHTMFPCGWSFTQIASRRSDRLCYAEALWSICGPVSNHQKPLDMVSSDYAKNIGSEVVIATKPQLSLA